MTPRTGTAEPVRAPGPAVEPAARGGTDGGADGGLDSGTERELRRMVLLHRRAALEVRRRARVPLPRRGMLGP